MPKPTTGRIDRTGPRTTRTPTSGASSPAPTTSKRRRRGRSTLSNRDVNRINDTALTALFGGVALFLGTLYFASFGGVFGFLGARTGRVEGTQVGFGIGLAVGLVVLVLLMRWRSDALQARSRNLYWGIWVGSTLALVVIVFMAYLPHLALPLVCPPGPGCGTIA